jgi:hypothetical protein
MLLNSRRFAKSAIFFAWAALLQSMECVSPLICPLALAGQ